MKTFYENPYHDFSVCVVRFLLKDAFESFNYTDYAYSSETTINPIIEGLIRELKFFVDNCDHVVSEDYCEQLQNLTNQLLKVYRDWIHRSSQKQK